MSLRKVFFVLVLGLSFPGRAQLFYAIDQTIPVEIDGKTLKMPWAGAFNSPQFNTMDLNGDHHPDLVIFDRTANKISTFLNVDNSYRYAPEYETMFPPEIDQWLLLRDFNCDGKKDIFTSDPFGIRAFVNVTVDGENLRWRKFNPDFPILTIGFTGDINLQVNAADIPAIDDVDGDGDLDILDARFVGIGSLEWHKNMSMENNGNCDSLQFKRITQTWGNFEECNCGEYIFGPGTCDIFGGRIKHAAGKSTITIDLDNDGDRDLLFSEETCDHLYLMPNTGTADSAIIESFSEFPALSPLQLQIFPAPYFEDLDFDGLPDLVVASNISTRTTLTVNFRESAWLYKNTGSPQLPAFTFVQNNFLQDQMIEVGDNAVPAFTDEDGDGDLDLFVGTNVGESIPSTLYYFQNTGTQDHPSMVLITKNYAGLSGLFLYNLRPQFADMNGDGKTDLVFTATDLQSHVTSMQYLLNRSAGKLDVDGQPAIVTTFSLSQPENVLIADINQDGINDLLVGRSTGSVQYWINNGPKGSLNFALQDESYLGLDVSTDRQSPAMAIDDLDADGKADLLLGDQRGKLYLFSNFRAATTENTEPEDLIFFNPLTETSGSTKLGGRIWPAIANLFNTNRPAIIVGNALGGMHVLINDKTKELPPDAVIDIYPNPVTKGADFFIKTDRNASVEFISVLGQKFPSEFTVPANEPYAVSSQGLSSGIYIARFSAKGKTYSRRFIVY